MKRNEYAGWKEVFLFSLRQELKQKSFRGFLILMCVVILAAAPVSTWLQQRDQERINVTEVSRFTIYDETGLGIDYSHALEGERYVNMYVAEEPGDGFASHVQVLEESQGSTEIIVHVTYEEAGYFNLTFVKAATADLKDKDCEQLSQDFESFFQDARIRVVDVNQEQLDFINQPVETRVEYTTEDGEITPQEGGEGISMTEYYVLLAGIVIVMMIVNMGGSQIALSIVTEKSTKVVEYLMINVRPMALIVGKILAALTAVVIQFAAYGVSYLLSRQISSALFGTVSDSAEAGETVGIMELFAHVNGVTLVLAAVMILVGVLFFSIVAGLAGASVSRMEEMAEGLKIYQLLLVVGSYIGIFLCIMQMVGNVSDVVVNICCILPLSAPFVMPANLLLGKVSVVTGLVSLTVVVVCTAALFSFTAKVYESLIFYNGNVLKLKDILQIARNRRAAVTAQRTGKGGGHHE
ncbi:MAG: ABC transporter permease [Acetatifactor sp.]|nr:ABC transporter permease [Acetatifactor sp.]